MPIRHFHLKAVIIFLLLHLYTGFSASSISQNRIKSSDPMHSTREAVCYGTAACPGSSQCLECEFPNNCQIGAQIPLNCSSTNCEQQNIVRIGKCQFCWQLDNPELDCEMLRNCSTNDVALHKTICKARPNVICAGNRTFYKKMKCHWTSGYSWRKALFLSITMGGFGVDRFYLGHWKSAIGKLFSFGGLGVWTLLDIVLIAIGYIQPADESEYLI